MTKSQATMYGLAAAQAAQFGPRIAHDTAGMFLTVAELKSLYAANGFNVSANRKTIQNHVITWQWCDRAYADGDLTDDRTVVWFPVPRFDRTAVRILSEQCNGRFIEDITTALPGIAAMHSVSFDAEGME